MSTFADASARGACHRAAGAQCISFLNELANAKAATGWEPVVYMTNTCAASALILGASRRERNRLYPQRRWEFIDVQNPEVAAAEPAASYIAEMEAQGLGRHHRDRRSRWNAGEVTVAALIEAAASPDGLTQASIINAAGISTSTRRCCARAWYHDERRGGRLLSQDVQIIVNNVADGFYTDIGE